MLPDLPNDILHIVWDYVHPLDVPSFCLTCRNLSDSARARRLPAHKELLGEYRNCRLVQRGHHGKHLLDLLVLIHRNFFIGQYITSLTYFNDDRWSGNNRIYDHVSDKERNQLQAVVGDLLYDSGGFVSFDQEPHLQYALQGDEAPLFVLLLAYLPNLKELKLHDLCWDLELVRQGLHTFNTCTPGINRYSYYSRPLHRLETVEVAQGNPYRWTAVQHLSVWSCIPSVTKLKGNRLITSDEETHASPRQKAQRHNSNVQIIDIADSICSPNDLRDILRGSVRLREFRYHQSELTNPELTNPAIAAQEVIDVLRETVGGSLQVLSFSGGVKDVDIASFYDSNEKIDPITTLEGFPMLNHLEMDGSFFFDAPDNPDSWRTQLMRQMNDFGSSTDEEESPNEEKDSQGIPALVDILPGSLKTLTINLEELDEERDVPPLFRDWDSKPQKLPLLDRVTYAGPKLQEALRETIKAQGVRLFNKRSWKPTWMTA